MAINDWQDVPVENEIDDWQDVAPEKESSLLDDIGTSVRSFTQGGSFGFSDEIAGAAEAAGRAVGLKGLGTSDRSKFINLPEFTTPTWDADELSQAYNDAKQNELKDLAKDSVESPYLSTGANVVGSVMSPLSRIGSAATLPKAIMSGAAQGGIMGAGATDGSLLDVAQGAAQGTALGGVGGGAGYGIGKGIEKAAPYVESAINKTANYLGEGFKNTAGKLMEKATGATGRESEKFADGSGRRLIEEGYGRAFDDPAAIAARAERALNASGERIGSILDEATARGTKIDLVDFLDQSEKQVSQLRNAGHNIQADALEARTAKVIEDAQRLGHSEVSPSYLENVKRESQANINYGPGGDVKPVVAGKMDAASLQRQMVEDSFGDNSTALEAFKKDKDLFGFLSPIQKASQRRANTLNQSPIGGLLDVATGTLGSSALGAGLGYGSGGDATSALTGALALGAGRRYVAPRIPSTVAIGLHNVGDLIQKAPQMFGKYAGVLQQAAQRGPNGVASTHFLLQQQDEGYREMMRQIADKE